MTLENAQKTWSVKSEKPLSIKLRAQDPNKYTPKEAMTIAIAAIEANEINRQQRMREKVRADVAEKYIEELMGAIEKQRNIITSLQPENETYEEYKNKLDKFIHSEDPRIKEIEQKQIEEMAKKQEDILRSKYNYTVLMTKK